MMDVDQFFPKALKAFVLIAAGSAAVAAPTLAQPLPEAGRPGCYAKIAYPPQYKTVTERVPGAPVVSYRDLPPVVEHYARQVLAAPARVEHEAIAPVYRMAWRWIEVPGPARQVSAPPVYRTITERQLIAPAHLVWRPGGGAHGFVPGGAYGQGGGLQAHPTGEVLCRVLVPARYAVIRRRVLVSPGRQYTVQGPPRHVKVQDRVLAQPGRTVEHVILATYRTVDTVRTVRPASRQRIVSPGPVRIVSSRVLASPARYSWAPIVCTPHQGAAYHAPMRPLRAPVHSGQRYAPAPAPVSNYSGPEAYGAAPAQHVGHTYRPDEILAPTPTYPAADASALVPAPYDVGHPARR